MNAQRVAGRWWALGVLCLAILLVSLDITILNVALPTISRSLGAGTAQLQWIVDAYTLAFAGAMLPAGLLGDRIGRKKVLLGGLLLFTVASVFCALSGSSVQLIISRAVMGLGASIVMPLTLALGAATFDDSERPRAIAIITAAIAGGLPLGPIVGGILLEHFDWGSVFWINVPVGLLAVVAGSILLPESRAEADRRFDLPGVGLAVGSVLLLTFGLIDGPVWGWYDGRTVGPIVAAIVLLVAFLRWERATEHKLVDPELFVNQRFTWGTVAAVVVSVALFGLLFVIPQYIQAVLGRDALGTGLRLVPLMGGLLVSGGGAGVLDKLLGTKLTVTLGLAVLAAGLAVLAMVRIDDGYGVTAVGLTVCGLGVGGAMAPAMDAVMAAVGGDEAGIGSAVTNTLRQVGGAVAVAGLGSLLSAVYSDRLAPSLVGLPHQASSQASGSVMGAMAVAQGAGTRGWRSRTTRGCPSSPGCRRSCRAAWPSSWLARCWCCASCPPGRSPPARHPCRPEHYHKPRGGDEDAAEQTGIAESEDPSAYPGTRDSAVSRAGVRRDDGGGHRRGGRRVPHDLLPQFQNKRRCCRF